MPMRVIPRPDRTVASSVIACAAPVVTRPLALSSLRLTTVGLPGLVLGYAAHTPDELRDAVRRLSTVVTGSRPGPP
ncbi:MAG TPA: hypothetical protein VFY84_21375 [Jiangellales bacterium]|nr:hypothetical protein [Jiangellales bacterium]